MYSSVPEHSFQESPHLSVNLKGSSFLVQLDGGDAGHLPGLLDVAAVAADGQAHQIRSHHKLFLERRHQLPGALRRQNTKFGLARSSFEATCFSFLSRTKDWVCVEHSYRLLTNLQMLGCLMVAGHEQQLGPDVAQVHVAEQRHALDCGLTGGLEQEFSGYAQKTAAPLREDLS